MAQSSDGYSIGKQSYRTFETYKGGTFLLLPYGGFQEQHSLSKTNIFGFIGTFWCQNLRQSKFQYN